MTAKKEKKNNSKDDLFGKFDSAMKALYSSDYERAEKHFKEIAEADTDRPEIIEKAQSMLKVCSRELSGDKDGNPGDTVEAAYDKGVYYHNNKELDKALDQFKQSQKMAGEKQDFIYYAMAATQALLGKKGQAVESLKEAIKLNETCRIYATNDPDFEKLSEEKDFKALVNDET
jgi:tetratricopeptide (TPR) repeat protein